MKHVGINIIQNERFFIIVNHAVIETTETDFRHYTENKIAERAEKMDWINGNVY